MKAARGPFASDFPRPDSENYVPLLIIKQSLTWYISFLFLSTILTSLFNTDYRLKFINFETADSSNLLITNVDFREFFLDSLYIMGFLINQTLDMLQTEHNEMNEEREEDDSSIEGKTVIFIIFNPTFSDFFFIIDNDKRIRI